MTLAQQIPTRSSTALGALDIFYTKLNAVNFYVEDEEQENLYFTILKKHFPTLNFSKIFPLGGKTNVLAHAKNPINKKNKTKKVYLVDLDFDPLLGSMENIKNVFYLDRYCIENYLIEPAAIIEIVIENNPKLKAVNVAKTLNLGQFITHIESSLRELFLLFYAAQRFDLGIKNCASKAEEFCEDKSRWKVDQAKIDHYRNTIALNAVPPKTTPALLDPSTDPRLQTARDSGTEQLISGKFLLAILFHYIKSKYSLGSITFDSFVYRVAKNSELDSLQPTVTKIKTYISPRHTSIKKTGMPA